MKSVLINYYIDRYNNIKYLYVCRSNGDDGKAYPEQSVIQNY